MDAYELHQALQKVSIVETPRPPLFPAEKNHGATTISRSRTKEVSSRYKSPTPNASSRPRRSPSPVVTRTASANISVPKRAVSAERRRPSTPPRTSPSTPVQHTNADVLLASRKVSGNRLPESLWPSTLRSLSVSFQSDTLSLPVSKREKPANHVTSDRTLRPSSNASHKYNESPPSSRKSTPERKRSPLKGKNSAEHTENSRPIESVHSRLVEQHRWPSRAGGKISSNMSNRSIDLTDKGKGEPSFRRFSLDGISNPSQKSATDLKPGITRSVDDNSLLVDRAMLCRLFEKANIVSPAVRSQSLPTPPGSRPAATSSTSVSRGASPSRTKSGSSTTSSRGSSPARSRPSSPARQSNPTSVLSFIADIKKGMKGANHIEDVHQLRMLYNRQLQWRYANALADVSLHSQKEKDEITLYSTWRATFDLRRSVIDKSIQLNQMRLKSKLCSVLNGQLSCLDEWASIERDHTESLFQAIKALQATTLRLPITAGARGDVQTVKVAVSSAVDIVEAMGSSICSLMSQVEDTNSLVSEVANVSAQETAMLYECETLLESTLAMQIEDCSLRSHLIQLKEAWKSERLVL